MLGERRLGGVSSSGIRVVGFVGLVPHQLGARWRLDLEELRDQDAPELANVARVDAVRSCRVAELVREHRREANKTLSNKDSMPLWSLSLCLYVKKTPRYFLHSFFVINPFAS